MISALYLASALVLGVALTRRLRLPLLRLEAYGLSVALGLLIWNWLAFICALILPLAVSLPLTLVIASTASVWLWRRSGPWQWRSLPGGRSARLGWGVFTLVTTLVIGWLMWTHDILPGPGGLYSANATWADFGVHASIINHFVAADRLLMDFPVAAGAHLTYPFMVDLLSSWLVQGGWALHAAIFVPSLLLVTAFLQLMLGFGIRVFGKLGGAVIGLTVSLLCGSAVGLFTAFSDLQASGISLTEFLNNLPKDYTALSQPNAQVTNMLADALLPQRAFLMGTAVAAAVLVIFTRLRERPSWRLAIFTGAIIGLLPLVHAHTFIVLVAIGSALWLEAVLKTKRFINPWMAAGITALGLAAGQIAWQALANGTGSGGHLAPGWTIQPGESLLTFWAHNYGLTGLLIIGCSALLISRPALRRHLVWYGPMVVIFLVANLYSFQAFPYDNLKLILYVYLFTYIFAGYGAVWLVRRSKLALIPLAVLAILLTGSGTLAVAREFQHEDLFASTDDIALADWVRTSTRPTDVFLATDKPNQPIATLAGRSLVSGYRGWLYSYNFDYQPRLAAIQSALNGELTADNPYQAQYLAVAPYESPEWTVNQAALMARYEAVYSNPSWTVYQLPR